MAVHHSPFHTSVHSLPPGKLKDIQHMFDKSAEIASANAADGLTRTKCGSINTNEHCNIANNGVPIDQGKRGMLSIGSKLALSPTCQESPSNCSAPIYHKTDHASEDHTEKGHLSVLSNIGGLRVSDTESKHTVLKIKDKYELNSCGTNGEITAKTLSGYQHSSTNIDKVSPMLLRRKKELPKCYEDVDNSSNKSCLDVNNVSERSKLIEAISSLSVAGSSLKSHTRKESLLKEVHSEQSSSEKKNSCGKVPLPCPLTRQRSLTETHDKTGTSHHGDYGEEDHGNTEKSTDKKLFVLPTKPQRTGAHDDYIMVRKPNVNVIIQNYERIDNMNKTTDVKGDLKTPLKHFATIKPSRLPPFMKKPRSNSVAADSHSLNYKSTDVSDYEEIKDNNLFYEVSPAYSGKQVNSPIQHWDLPRFSYPEPNQMSLSAECIQKAVDEEGTVVYLNPNDVLNSGSFEVCLDSEGYAVPGRIVRRKGSDMDSAVLSKHIRHKVKSKIKRFKHFFTDSSDVDKMTQRNPKARLAVIRQKVNEAFEILQNSKSDCNDTSTEKQSNGSDSPMEHVKIQKCINYCRSVKIKTSQSINESKRYLEKSYSQLFELAMVVGLELNLDTGVYKPAIIYKFPELHGYRLTMEGNLFMRSGLTETNVSVPLFCFPDAANFKPSSSTLKSQSYNFVLTHFDAQRLYGYCRRYTPPKSPNKTPEVICIISPVDAFTMYNTLLKEIEKKRLISMDAAQELISAAFGRPLPQPGQAELIRTSDEHGETEPIFLNRETDSRWESVSCECLLISLGSETLLKVFSSMLLERSILFCAKQLSTLSSTIHAIVSLLYPLAWQHTFIPVLPSEMIDVICSPTPYIIGITASLMQKALSLPMDEHVLVVDIDKRSLLKSQGDEKSLLPHKIEKALKRSLNMCKVDSDAKSDPDMMISEAFLRFFVEAIGHYGLHIIAQDEEHKIFQKREFLNGTHSKTLKQLLEWLVETQMFEVFITKQMEKSWGNTLEYFESMVREHNFTTIQHS